VVFLGHLKFMKGCGPEGVGHNIVGAFKIANLDREIARMIRMDGVFRKMATRRDTRERTIWEVIGRGIGESLPVILKTVRTFICSRSEMAPSREDGTR